MQRRVEELGLDISHFTGRRRWSDSHIRTAIMEATTWAGVLKHLGLADSGENRARVRRHATRIGADTDHLASEDLPSSPRQGIAQLEYLHRIAEPLAIAWFEFRGHTTAVPGTAQPYDLLVEVDGIFRKVQVKSTTYRDPSCRSWLVRIGRRIPGATKNGPLVPYTPEEVDMFFIVDGELTLYLIPGEVVRDNLSLNLTKYAKCQVGSAVGMLKSV